MDLKTNKTYQLLFAALTVMILVIITFRGSLKNSFVDWDDYGYVVDNELVRNHDDNYVKNIFTSPVLLNYHPVTIFSLRLNNNECKSCPEGISPRPFIQGNIILHILNSLLVLILIFLITDHNIIASLLVAILFGVHPMHVESVSWISERKDVLYSFFFLGGLILYLIFKKRARGGYLWLVFSFVLFVLSCLSKATAVVFPVVLILFNFWIDNTEGKPVVKSVKNAVSYKNLLILAPFFIVSVFFGLMAYRIQNNENFPGILNLSKNAADVVNTIQPFSILQRFQVAGYGFIMYIFKFFVPINLMAFYPYPELKEFSGGSFPVILWGALAVTILIAAVSIWSLKKTKLYAFGIGFFFITIALVLQFVSVGNAIMANRYSYLPYIGLSLIPALLITGSSRRTKNIMLAISGCFVILLMFMSAHQVKTWKNTETLWTNVINKHPDLELARRARGKYYSKMSELAKSKREKEVLEEKAFSDFTVAVKQGTKSSDVFEGSALIFDSRGEIEKALIFINQAISMNPEKGGAYYNRAMIFDKLNEKEKAVGDYSRALELDQSLELKILSNRAVLYLETGKYNEAKGDLDRLISIDSRNFMYYYNRAYTRLKLGDIEGAISDYRKAIQLNPDDQTAKKQLQVLIDSRNH
ncbi:MAG: tetratricopeptide repeat protein [Bacteroidia bacterium]|nr:tetratricopeptide repeat protein [Bacteroidia bacterium]